MDDVVIRPITVDDDMAAQLDLGERAFGIYSASQRAGWSYVAGLRAGQGLFLGAFVGGAPAGAAMIHDLRQWWLGREVPCAGVASVKVAPEYRGGGIGRRLMAALLDTVAERGYSLSALYPATMPIYRALGWELAGGKYQATIPARSLRTLVAPDPAAQAAHGGTDQAGAARARPARAALPEVRRAGPDDAAEVIAVIGRAHHAARDAGPLTWDEGPTGQWLSRPDLYSYLAGEDGFAAYRWDGAGHADLLVERVHAARPESLRALWAVIASHSSVARTVTALTAPNDPFWWLTAERDATIAKRSMWMLRVVDAPAAIAARGFPPAVSVGVPLQIRDQTRPGNTGHWRLAVSDGKGALVQNGSVGGAAASAALTVGPRGLAALYAGTPVATLRLSGLAAGGAADADAALDAAFAATPYMVDDF
ncbi:MAG TPA: GNAT family N-acetyltransferase [Trebonia sp.]|nr:GNAT family N-acetyltransferase [Trebonia sp.]